MRALITLLAATVALATLVVPSTDADASTLRATWGLYEVRPDLRRCVSPLCGGYWLRAVNHQQTTCFDGTVADACYVAEIDWNRAGWNATQVADYFTAAANGPMLIGGRQIARTYMGFGDLGVMVPVKAFTAFDAP